MRLIINDGCSKMQDASNLGSDNGEGVHLKIKIE